MESRVVAVVALPGAPFIKHHVSRVGQCCQRDPGENYERCQQQHRRPGYRIESAVYSKYAHRGRDRPDGDTVHERDGCRPDVVESISSGIAHVPSANPVDLVPHWADALEELLARDDLTAEQKLEIADLFSTAGLGVQWSESADVRPD